MKERIVKLAEEATAQCRSEKLFEVQSLPFIELEVTRDEAHGDYASNAPTVIASPGPEEIPARSPKRSSRN